MTLNDPFATHPPVPSFTVTSTTLKEGDTLGIDQMSGIFGVPGGSALGSHEIPAIPLATAQALRTRILAARSRA